MKKTIFAMVGAALALGFTGCSKESNLSKSSAEGTATKLKVSLTFPRTETTRNTGDLNGTDNESQVNTVDVFIYTSGGAFSSHAPLDASDFSQETSTGSADVYEATTKIPTTTGAKSVFVGINLPTSVVNAVKNQPASALFSAVQTMSRAQLAGATNFAMFSTQAVNSTFVEDENDPANSIKVQCKRLVAKVTVETSATLNQDGAPGVINNLQFAINNFNTKLFLIQGAADYHKDPNWASGSYVAGDFNDAEATDYAPILSRALITTPAIEDYTPLYAAENTSEGKLKNEITRVTVRATFIPTEIVEGTTGNFTVDNAHGITTPQTFYAVTPSVMDGTAYFFDSTAADEFADERGGSVITYTGGFCYWDIFLNKNPDKIVNRWDVLRNDFYKCNITRIVLPGRYTPDITDPGITPDTDTSIFVDVELLFWHTPILANYELE